MPSRRPASSSTSARAPTSAGALSIGLLAAALTVAGSAAATVGAFRGGFGESAYEVSPGAEFSEAFEFVTDTAFRNVTWFAYLNPAANASKFPEERSLFLHFAGPDWIPAHEEVSVQVRFPVPDGLRGAHMLGVAWDAEYRSSAEKWRHVPVTTNAVGAGWLLDIRDGDDGRDLSMPTGGAVVAGLALAAASVLAAGGGGRRR